MGEKRYNQQGNFWRADKIMNRKGQFGVGVLIICAIAVIIGLVLLPQIATNVEQGTRTVTSTIATGNSYQITGVLNTPVDVIGQELVTTTKVQNGTGDIDIPAANYTLTECIRSGDSLKGICYTALGVGANTDGKSGVGLTNLSYSYYPDGYIDDAGSRSIAGIIILLAAIGIAVVCIPRAKELFN